MLTRCVAQSVVTAVGLVVVAVVLPVWADEPAPAPAASDAGTTTVAAPPPTAPPREAGPVAEQGAGRTLNGHRFMPTGFVVDPFVQTSLGSILILGLGSTTGHLQAGDRVFSGSFDYAGMGALITYERAFGEHFSARIALENFIYSGINGESALVIGSTLQVGVGGGGTGSIRLGDSVRLGALFDVSYAPNLALTIGSGISSIIETCSGAQGCVVDPGKVFGTTKVLTLKPSVAASWAPLRSLGATAAVGLAFSSSSGAENLTGQAIVVGGAVDFDLLAVSSVPLGLQALVNYTGHIGGSGVQDVLDLGGGLFYTGQKDLSVGAQILFRRFAIRPDVDVSWNTVLVGLGLRYYW
jgi:hypothetical protein